MGLLWGMGIDMVDDRARASKMFQGLSELMYDTSRNAQRWLTGRAHHS